MQPRPLIRRFAPRFLKVSEVSETAPPGFFSPPGRRWREAPDEGASPNA